MKILFKRLRSKKGFTLVELMVVIVIIGILASIGIPRFRTAVTRAKVAEFKMILEQIYSLEENYFSEHDGFTADLEALGFDDPKAKYFTFTVESDSTSFLAIATCTANLKGPNGVNMRGMKATVNQDGVHDGDIPLRKISKW